MTAAPDSGSAIAWVFPGQGAQRRGMGAELFPRFPDLTAVAEKILGYSLRELCLEDPDDRLRRTEYQQPALFAVAPVRPRRFCPVGGVGMLAGSNENVDGAGADFLPGTPTPRGLEPNSSDTFSSIGIGTPGNVPGGNGLPSLSSPCIRSSISLRASSSMTARSTRPGVASGSSRTCHVGFFNGSVCS